MATVAPSARSDQEWSHGTTVLFQWADWNRTHGNSHPVSIRVVENDEAKLVVHEYKTGFCGILKILKKPNPYRIADFREWHQPSDTVVARLLEKGWRLVGQEVGHAATH